MSENHLSGLHRPRLLLGACCILVALVGVGRFFAGYPLLSVVTGGFENELFDSEPGHTLRVIESVGILLPLFAGLLRFTTNDRTAVSDRVNDYLLLGILGLVLAGVVATLAGVGTNVAGVLKISLFFVLLTFTAIGIATIDMLSRTADPMEGTGHAGTDRRNGSVAETRENELESETVSSEADERAGNEEESEAQTGAESDFSGRGAKQAVERADAPEAASTISTNNCNNNDYDGRDVTSEDESESQGRPE